MSREEKAQPIDGPAQSFAHLLVGLSGTHTKSPSLLDEDESQEKHLLVMFLRPNIVLCGALC